MEGCHQACTSQEYRIKTHSSLSKIHTFNVGLLILRKKAIPKIQTEHQSQVNHLNKMK